MIQSNSILSVLVFLVSFVAVAEDASTQDASTQDAKPSAESLITQEKKEEEIVSPPKAIEGWDMLFDGKTLKGWKVTKFGGEGEVNVAEGRIVMDYGSPITGITYTGKPPRIDYEIELEAMPIEGLDFFVGLTMPVKESYISLIVAGWAGAVVGLSNIDDKDASENETTKFMKFDEGKWYKIRTQVRAEQITCWINGKKIIQQDIKGRKIGIRPEVELSTPLGLSAFETRTAYRNIRIRKISKPVKEKPVKEKPEIR